MADKKLQDLELKVTQLRAKLRIASGSASYNSVKKELDAAEKELNDYKSKSKTVEKQNETAKYTEQYPGQTDYEKALSSRYLELVTNSDGTSSVKNNQAIGAEGKPGYIGPNSQHFIYIGPETYVSDATGARPYEKGAYANQTTVTVNLNDVIKQAINDYQKTTGGVDALFNKLYSAGYISKATFDSKDLSSNGFSAGISAAINNYSKKVVSDYQFGDRTKQPASFDSYLSSVKISTSDTKTRAYYTLRQDAIEQIDKFFMDYLGRGATPAEEAEYYKLLNSLEKKNVERTTTTQEGNVIQSGELVDDAARLELQRKVAGKALNGSNLDTVIKSGAGVSRSVNSLIQTARNYGIRLSQKEAIDYIGNDLNQGRFDEKAMSAKLVQIAKANYSNLADLSDTVSLRELSGNLIYNMANTLELPQESIDVFDPVIQTALKNNGKPGMMSLTDFEVLLRNDPRWAKTRNAKEEASKYAYEILNSFGLMA